MSPMSPIRNFIKCELIKDNVVLGEFDSIVECCEYAKNNYNLSFTMLQKYKKHKGYIIKV